MCHVAKYDKWIKRPAWPSCERIGLNKKSLPIIIHNHDPMKEGMSQKVFCVNQTAHCVRS